MRSRTLFALLFLAFVAVASAASDDDGYNEVTIRPSDIPTDAPRFEDFPVEVYSGRNAVPNLRSEATTRMFRSRLAQWAKEKPNFAGHYILATWGCGTDCTQIAIIDAKTGKIFHPAGVTTNVAVNVHHDLLEGGDLWHASGAIKFRNGSRLLVLIGMPEERTKDRGISYYVWERDRLRLVRFVPKAWYPESK
jgi:hypothetical protein